MAAFERTKKMAEKAAKLGPNPAERMEGPVWHRGQPYRPTGCFSEPKYPTKIILPWRPVGSRPGENSKKV